MIEFTTSTGIRKETGIDFDLLGYIISRVLNIKRKTKVSIHKSKLKYSYVHSKTQEMFINLNIENTTKKVINTILHEMAHILQYKKDKNQNYDSYNSYWEYYNSPEEKDARMFHKLTTDVFHIYNRFISVQEKINKYDLLSKELIYNEMNKNKQTDA